LLAKHQQPLVGGPNPLIATIFSCVDSHSVKLAERPLQSGCKKQEYSN